MKEIDKIPHIKYYKKNQIPDDFHFRNLNTRKMLIVAEEGYLLGIKEKLESGILN